MSYVNRPIDDITPDPAIVTKATDYHDLVRWGNYFRSCSSLSDSTDFERPRRRYWDSFLSDSGAPRSNAGGVGTGVGIWSIISLFISLIVGGWITTRACGPMNRGSSSERYNSGNDSGTWRLLANIWGIRCFGVAASRWGSLQPGSTAGGVQVPTTHQT